MTPLSKDLVARYEYECPDCEGRGYIYTGYEHYRVTGEELVGCSECEGEGIRLTYEGMDLARFVYRLIQRHGKGV